MSSNTYTNLSEVHDDLRKQKESEKKQSTFVDRIKRIKGLCDERCKKN